MYVIDDELKEFIESGVALAVGTADRQGRPHLAMAWGPKVKADRTSVTMFLETSRSAMTLDDIRATGWVAATFAHPVSYRSIQLKGRSTVVGEPDEAELARVQQHREEFTTSTALIGDPPAIVRSFWVEGEPVLRVDCQAEQAFDQTPGPEAGRPL